MSEDTEAHSHQNIQHNGETYIKLADAAVTFRHLRAEITRLRAELATARREGMEDAARIPARMRGADGARDNSVNPRRSGGGEVMDWQPTSTIVWHPIETAPIGRRIFVADLIDKIRHIGIGDRSGDGSMVFLCPGIPATPASHWTHWADLPDLPEWDDRQP